MGEKNSGVRRQDSEGGGGEGSGRKSSGVRVKERRGDEEREYPTSKIQFPRGEKVRRAGYQ